MEPPTERLQNYATPINKEKGTFLSTRLPKTQKLQLTLNVILPRLKKLKAPHFTVCVGLRKRKNNKMCYYAF